MRLPAIVELPRGGTREAYEAALRRHESLPADDPHRDALIEGARRNLAVFDAGREPLPPREQQILVRSRQRLAERRSGA